MRPEGDGISREELLELLQTCATSEDDLSRAEFATDGAFGRASRLAGESFTAARVLEVARASPALLDEFQRQLAAFRAAVQGEFRAILEAEKRAAERRAIAARGDAAHGGGGGEDDEDRDGGGGGGGSSLRRSAQSLAGSAGSVTDETLSGLPRGVTKHRTVRAPVWDGRLEFEIQR